MSIKVSQIDATPEKRSFFAIINDYDLKMSISELVDNSIDYWRQSNNTSPLEIEISLDDKQQTISIKDNAGGVSKENMRFLVSPGASQNSEYDSTIGFFGVGSKRAMIALAQDIKVSSQHFHSEKAYGISFDDSWLTNESWELDLVELDNHSKGSTIIFLQRLRNQINPVYKDPETGTIEIEDSIELLKAHLSSTYGKILDELNIRITLNSEKITPKLFDNAWSYPKNLEPYEISMDFLVEDKRAIKVKITGGLLKEGAAGNGEHGVYLYCNRRLITKAHRSPQVGYITGQAGSPDHLNINRVIVDIQGPAKYMPWDSSKSRINFNNEVLKTIQKKIIEVVTHTTKISRSLEKDGQWRSDVFPFTKGEVVRQTVDISTKSLNKYLPPVPKSRPRFIDRIKKKNLKITKVKAWTSGIVDSMIAYDAVQKLNIGSKNKLLLILLDSTLEISLKEYLVHESGTYYSDKKLMDIFSKRHAVIEEVKKTVDLDESIWKNLSYYNGIRNKLIHERNSAQISNEEIESFRSMVNTVLKRLYELEFE